MAKFDIAIRVLQDEYFRTVGKLTVEFVDKSISPRFAVRDRIARELEEAVEILKKHQHGNKKHHVNNR